MLSGINVCLEKVKKASETGTVDNNKKPAARITYVPSEDMVIMAWGTGASYEEACNNANCNVINQVVSLFGNGTKDDCQIKGCRLICKFTQSDGSKKVATYSIIKTPMLNGGNSSDGSTASFGGSKFGAKEKMMEKNKAMEMEILNEVLRQTKIRLPKMYTRRLSVSEPKNMTKDALAERLDNADGTYNNENNIFAASVAYGLNYRRLTPQWNATYKNVDTWMNTANSSSLVKFYIKYVLNDSDDNNVYLMLKEALDGIRMSKAEIIEYDKVNKHKTRFVYSLDNEKDRIIYCLRSSDKELLEWMNRYVNVLYDYYLKFDIVDNLGGRSHISNVYNARIHRMSRRGSMTEPSLSELNNVFVFPLGGYDISKYDNVYIPNEWDETKFRAYFLKGTGLFAPYAVLCDYLLGYYPYFYSQLIQDDTSDDPYVEGTASQRDEYGSFANRNKRIDFTVFTNPELSIQFLMPNAKMSEYTSFSIKDRKQ